METIPLNINSLAQFTREIHAVKQTEVNKSRAPYVIGAVIIVCLVIYYLHQNVFIPRYRDRHES